MNANDGDGIRRCATREVVKRRARDSRLKSEGELGWKIA